MLEIIEDYWYKYVCRLKSSYKQKEQIRDTIEGCGEEEKLLSMARCDIRKSGFREINFRPVHPFPARMAPSIAWDSLKICSNQSLRVLDPMVGSGTTAVVARSLGHIAIGFDFDPLAVLIANAWCSDIDSSRVLSKATEVLDRAKKRYHNIPLCAAYPRNSTPIMRTFVQYWFDNTNRRQLAALSETISRLRDASIKTVLWCAFSRLIITKKVGVSLAMDISHSRPHRVCKKAPIKPFDKFLYSVETIVKSSPFKANGSIPPEARIGLGDARKLSLPNRSIDVVITSPPYLNAIDYLRGHKLALIWMGHTIADLRKIRSSSVGAEKSLTFDEKNSFITNILYEMGKINSLPVRIKGMLARYILDMNLVLREISRVLKLGGQAVLVIGDSTIYGTFIQNSRALISLGMQYGLDLCTLQKRDIQESRRYLPPPTSKGAGTQLQGRMREEVIMTFKLRA